MTNWAALFKKVLGKSDEEEKWNATRMGVCAKLYQLVREISDGLQEFDPEGRLLISTQNADNNKRVNVIVSVNGVAKDTVVTFMLDEKRGWPVNGTYNNIEDVRSYFENQVGNKESKLIKTIIWAKMPPKEAEPLSQRRLADKELKQLEQQQRQKQLEQREEREQKKLDHEEEDDNGDEGDGSS